MSMPLQGALVAANEQLEAAQQHSAKVPPLAWSNIPALHPFRVHQ